MNSMSMMTACRRLVWTGLLMLFIAASAAAQEMNVSERLAGFDDYMAKILKDWNAPGVESLAGVLLLRDYGSFIDSLKRGEFIAILDVRKDDEPPSPPRRWKAAARVRLSMCR